MIAPSLPSTSIDPFRPRLFALLAILLFIPLPPALGAATGAELAASVDALFAPWTRPGSPGAIVAIAHRDDILLRRAYGLANLEFSIPLTPDTISETGSVAKQFTCAAVTLLAERGKLSLDAPIGRYLPALSPPLADIPLFRFLDHTSGLRELHRLTSLNGRPSYTTPRDDDDVFALLARQRTLDFAPGDEFLYSNSGYVLAALVVTRVSGLPFDEFCAREIFSAAGMPHSRWRSDYTAIVPGRAQAYATRSGGGWSHATPHSDIIGNGGMLTTVDDLLAWNRFISAPPAGEWSAVVHRLESPSHLNDGRPSGYGLGLFLDTYRGHRRIAHTGSTAGYRTILIRLPDDGFSIAILGNASNLDTQRLGNAILDTLLDLPPVAFPPTAPWSDTRLAAVAGLYYQSASDNLLRVEYSSAGLRLGSAALRPIGPDTLDTRPRFGRWRFTPPSADSAATFSLLSDDDDRPPTVFVAVPPADPGPAALAACVGRYYSPEVDATIPVTLDGRQLFLQVAPDRPEPLRPAFADAFEVHNEGLVTFIRDASGSIEAFNFTAPGGRARRVRYDRLPSTTP